MLRASPPSCKLITTSPPLAGRRMLVEPDGYCSGTSAFVTFGWAKLALLFSRGLPDVS